MGTYEDTSKRIIVVHIHNPFIIAVYTNGAELKVGQTVMVYSLSKDQILDPDTKKPLGHLEIIKGTGIVKNVQLNMAMIESNNYKTVRRWLSLTSPLYESQMVNWASKEVLEYKEPVAFKDPRVGDLIKLC